MTACETWALTKALERKLEVFENTILRRIYGPVFDQNEQAWRQRHNAELRELSRLPNIICYVRAVRLRWAGHVARMPEERLYKRYMLGRPEGRRPVGRPRLRWLDGVTRDLRQLGVGEEEWMQVAQDRRRWRALVEAARDHLGLQPPE